MGFRTPPALFPKIFTSCKSPFSVSKGGGKIFRREGVRPRRPPEKVDPQSRMITHSTTANKHRVMVTALCSSLKYSSHKNMRPIWGEGGGLEVANLKFPFIKYIVRSVRLPPPQLRPCVRLPLHARDNSENEVKARVDK